MIYQVDTITFSPEPSTHIDESWILIDVNKIIPSGINLVNIHWRLTFYFSTITSTFKCPQGDELWIYTVPIALLRHSLLLHFFSCPSFPLTSPFKTLTI